MTGHEHAYRGLLRFYPSSFRERYEEEMVTLFVDQLRDARASHSPTRIAWLWIRSVVDLVATAPGQHLTKEALVPQPLDPASMALTDPPSKVTLGRTGYAIALLPLWVGIFLRLFAPGFMEPLFANPPEVVGLPAGIILVFIAGLLMAFGVLAMRSARGQTGRTAAFLLLTVPSVILLVMTPALILVAQNLAV